MDGSAGFPAAGLMFICYLGDSRRLDTLKTLETLNTQAQYTQHQCTQQMDAQTCANGTKAAPKKLHSSELQREKGLALAWMAPYRPHRCLRAGDAKYPR